MMLGLIYKDFIVYSKKIGPIMVSIAFFSTVFFFSTLSDESPSVLHLGLADMLSTICIFLMVGMLEQGCFEIDERKKWQMFISSAENGIKKQIASKYALSFLLTSVTAVYLEIMVTLSGAIAGLDMSSFGVVIITIACIQLFIRSIENPFIAAFGSKYGNNVRIALTGIAVFGMIVYLLFGDLSVFGTGEQWLFGLLDFVNGVNNNSNDIYMLMTPAVLVIFYVSYLISCRFYLNGGENYDK